MKHAHAASSMTVSRMRVNLVTSCVSTKDNTVGSIAGLTDSFANGCNTPKEWLDVLSNNSNKMLPVLNLYKGDHWSIARDLNTLENVTLWVISAGLGFAHHSKLTRPYDATFNKSSPNYVGNLALNNISLEPTKNWWALLHGNKNAFKNLVEENPEQLFIFCASSSYLIAIENDLLDLVQKQLFNKRNFLIITSNKKINKNLTQYVLTSKEKFASSKEIMGSMVSLNIRLARYLIKASFHSANPLKEMIEAYEELDRSIPEVKRKKIKKTSDLDVISEISKLPESSLRSVTSALRALRSKGISCEQKRFSNIFKSYKSRLEF